MRATPGPASRCATSPSSARAARGRRPGEDVGAARRVQRAVPAIERVLAGVERGVAKRLAAVGRERERVAVGREAQRVRRVGERAAQMDECAGYRHVRAQRRRARVMALRGLVALHGAESDALIATLARGECARAIPPWPATPGEWAAQDEATGEFELACLARSAQQRNGACPVCPDAR